jgi:hypothetical protein
MRNNDPRLTWYRERINQRQRRANVLAIEVGLQAQDRDDPVALSETVKCLESAIAILERAKERSDAPHQEDAWELMEDLGHSLEQLDFSQPERRWDARELANRRQMPDDDEWALRASLGDESLRFFE